MEESKHEEECSLSTVSEDTSSDGVQENAEITLSRGYSVIEDQKHKKEKKSKGIAGWIARKGPFLIQSIIFSIAYTELSRLLLRWLNKKIFKTNIVFEWNIYRFIDVTKKSS